MWFVSDRSLSEFLGSRAKKASIVDTAGTTMPQLTAVFAINRPATKIERALSRICRVRCRMCTVKEGDIFTADVTGPDGMDTRYWTNSAGVFT